MTTYQFLKSLFEIILIVSTLVTMSILGSKILLEEHFTNISENITSINRQQASIGREIKDINKLLKETDIIQKEYTIWAPIVLEISQNIPEKVTLSTLGLDLKQKTFTFAGTASTRDELLKFQKNIENLDIVEGIQTPLSQLTQKENINFSFTAQIKNPNDK